MKEEINKSVSDKPPVFSSWKGWYLLLMVVLLVQLIFYFFLTRLFA